MLVLLSTSHTTCVCICYLPVYLSVCLCICVSEYTAPSPSPQPLSARLDEVLHVSADIKLPPLAPLPPEMQPIPSKPLFFDLAKNFIELPDLEHRFKEDKTKEGGGITGFVRGWLWGGKK